MGQHRIRSAMGLIAIIALSIWAGMLIERARSRSQGPSGATTYIVRPSADNVTVFTVGPKGEVITIPQKAEVSPGGAPSP